jgi:hypothetical protein
MLVQSQTAGAQVMCQNHPACTQAMHNQTGPLFSANEKVATHPILLRKANGKVVRG